MWPLNAQNNPMDKRLGFYSNSQEVRQVLGLSPTRGNAKQGARNNIP